MVQEYDVVIVGAEPNGLVAAGYLAKAGRRVLFCERRPVVDGAAVTEQPGRTAIECAWHFVQSVTDPTFAVDFWDRTNRPSANR